MIVHIPGGQSRDRSAPQQKQYKQFVIAQFGPSPSKIWPQDTIQTAIDCTTTYYYSIWKFLKPLRSGGWYLVYKSTTAFFCNRHAVKRMQDISPRSALWIFWILAYQLLRTYNVSARKDRPCTANEAVRGRHLIC